MEKHTKYGLFLSVVFIISFLPSLCFASISESPLFFLSESEYADIKGDLALSASQEEQINAIMRDKFQTGQVLNIKGNQLNNIIGAYDAIQNKKDYWDKESMKIAGGLSKKQIESISKDWERIEVLRNHSNTIYDVKIKAVLNEKQVAQWYRYKFLKHTELILSFEGILIKKDVLNEKVSKAVSNISVYNIIDQKIIDEIFLTMLSEIRQIKDIKRFTPSEDKRYK